MADESMLRSVREGLVDRVIRILAVVGGIAYVPSAWLAAREGLWPIFWADTVALSFVVALTFIKRIPYAAKAWSSIALCYSLGILLLYFTGPFGAGIVYLFAFAFLSALLSGKRGIIASSGIGAASLIAYAIACSEGILPWEQGLESFIVVAANFFIVSLMLSFAAHYLITGLARSAIEERALREQREGMIAEIEHRVKNNLQVISSLVNIRANSSAGAEKALRDIRRAINAISAVHQLLYRKDESYQIDASGFFKALTARFKAIYPELDLDFSWSGPEVELDSDKAVNIGIMMNEIIANAAKHAYGPGGRGPFHIASEFDPETEALTLEMADEGSGRRGGDCVDQSEEGLGLGIIMAIAESLRASISVSCEEGYRYRFRIGVSSKEAPR
jgi:two-component sensor histidine kinase